MKKNIEHLIIDSLTIEKIIEEYENTNVLIESLKNLLSEDIQMLVIEKRIAKKEIMVYYKYMTYLFTL